MLWVMWFDVKSVRVVEFSGLVLCLCGGVICSFLVIMISKIENLCCKYFGYIIYF